MDESTRLNSEGIRDPTGFIDEAGAYALPFEHAAVRFKLVSEGTCPKRVERQVDTLEQMHSMLRMSTS